MLPTQVSVCPSGCPALRRRAHTQCRREAGRREPRAPRGLPDGEPNCILASRVSTSGRSPNASLREQLGIAESAAVASRLLNEAVDANLIVVAVPNVGTRNRSYLPFWAASVPDRTELA